MSLDKQNNHISICRSTPSSGYHSPIQSTSRFKQTRSVNKYYLSVIHYYNSSDFSTGRLNFMSNDGNFRAHKMIQKRRLSSIWFSDEGHKACFLHSLSFKVSISILAAACSASRLLPASAKVFSPVCSFTCILNIGE